KELHSTFAELEPRLRGSLRKLEAGWDRNTLEDFPLEENQPLYRTYRLSLEALRYLVDRCPALYKESVNVRLSGAAEFWPKAHGATWQSWVMQFLVPV